MTKWPFRGKQRSGQFNLIKSDGTNYCIAHFLEVRSGWDNAQAIARLLHGPGKFHVKVVVDTYDTLGAGIYILECRHWGQPQVAPAGVKADSVVVTAQKTILSAVAEVGASARIQGWERHEVPEPPRRRPYDDGGDDDSDSPMGMPLPLFS
jgi:hypothetical protein